MDKEFLKTVLCFFIIFVVLPVLCFYILETNAKKCSDNGGIVVRTNIGIYEKCIYGGGK